MQQAMLLRHFKTAYPVIRRSMDVFSGHATERAGAPLSISSYIETFEMPLSRKAWT